MSEVSMAKFLDFGKKSGYPCSYSAVSKNNINLLGVYKINESYQEPIPG
jgi:hypothetical protein